MTKLAIGIIIGIIIGAVAHANSFTSIPVGSNQARVMNIVPSGILMTAIGPDGPSILKTDKDGNVLAHCVEEKP